MSSRKSSSESRLPDSEFQDLVRIHLGLAHQEERDVPENQHAETESRISPALLQGLAVLEAEAGSESQKVKRKHTTEAWQEELWPHHVQSAITALATSFYGQLGGWWVHTWRTSPKASYFGDLTSPYIFDARVDRLTQYVEQLADRISQVERLTTQLIPSIPGTSSLDIGALITNLETYTPKLSDAFERAFGTKVSISVRDGDVASDFPILVRLDASANDPDVINSARARGARAAFYEAVAAVVPSSLLDHTTFEFVFPSNASL